MSLGNQINIIVKMHLFTICEIVVKCENYLKVNMYSNYNNIE
ncbi:hypothetical protein Klosneuvirus_11_5 [Klosneuvirus KNV1]|uniref:Uncharacterized protein n=1 Tax=Klosneuvirus KNV1 TaxID=1977640 RepID=A0A1V0SLX8_9VIRU|nr:hypothetical protein Klosneuvirus_11_5 [Klosneuvirus KNV1]